MTATTFDTLKFAKRLKESGIPGEQAEAQAEALADAFETSSPGVAIKADLRELELKITNQLTLLTWMMGFMLAGVVSLVMKTFFV